jgi:DNA-nicking Smr family endonuclease
MKKLDLHGLKHEDVKRKVIHFIEDNWNSGEVVEIITGHSPKMKHLTADVLDEYNLKWSSESLFLSNAHSQFDGLGPSIRVELP